jgi:cytoskeletal protein CcmA (bactofilin family)
MGVEYFGSGHLDAAATMLGDRDHEQARERGGKFYSHYVPPLATQISMIPLSSDDLGNSSPAGKCTLSSGVKIKGSIRFQKDLLIDGKVQGEINSDGALTIGENAHIRGEIKTRSVTVHGKVHGNITAERCELKSKSTVVGDLNTARLIIEEGATFSGTSLNPLVSTGESPEIAPGQKTEAFIASSAR